MVLFVPLPVVLQFALHYYLKKAVFLSPHNMSELYQLCFFLLSISSVQEISRMGRFQEPTFQRLHRRELFKNLPSKTSQSHRYELHLIETIFFWKCTHFSSIFHSFSYTSCTHHFSIKMCHNIFENLLLKIQNRLKTATNTI